MFKRAALLLGLVVWPVALEAQPIEAVTITVTPSEATVQINQTQDFTAVIPGANKKKVKFSVCDGNGQNCVMGGNATLGTIVIIGADAQNNPIARYTAPASVPTSNCTPVGENCQVKIRAKFRNKKAFATVTLAPSGCPSPFTLFFLDPPRAYNGISTPAAIYTSGLTAAASAAALHGPSAQTVTLDFSSPSTNQLLTTLGAGLAAGSWDLSVTNQDGCTETLPGALVVSDTTSLALDSVAPSVAWSGEDTRVTITASGGGFVFSPRAYLVPALSPAAASLGSVVFVDATRLRAVVPAGLTPGQYDLVVVNPDASVGTLSNALTVVADEPPTVSLVSPEFWATNPTPAAAFVFGSNFRPGPSVTVEFRDPVTSNLTTVAAAIVGTPTATEIDITVDMSAVTAGSTGVVTVTNSDGTSFAYSAVALYNPAQGVTPAAFQAGQNLNVARRAPALVTAQVASGQAFLYAIGGDDGFTSSALSSLESAALGLFGEPGPWSLQRDSLAEGRTFAGAAAIGRFLYLVGGHDGSAPTNKVLRAQLLDPADAPSIENHPLSLGGGPGLAGGLWTYQVAAVYDNSDPNNPGGESLASEAVVVEVPSIAAVQVTLAWTAAPDAVAYRLYRTPAVNQSADQTRLLTELAGGGTTSFTDDGSLATTTAPPLALGSLGRWHEVAAMNLPRMAHAVGAAPFASGTALYAIAGSNDGSNPLNSYEFLTVNADGSLPLGAAWLTGGGNTLATARRETAAWVVTGSDNPKVGSDAWVYVGPGRTSGGFTGAVTAARVDAASGNLEAWIEAVDDDGSRAGFVTADGANFLFLFGGAGGGPSNDGFQAEICEPINPACLTAPTDPPDLVNWNTVGVSMLVARIYPGHAEHRPFLYVAGGTTLDTSASASVEWTSK